MLLPSLFLRQSTKLTHNTFQQIDRFFQIRNRFLAAFYRVREIVIIHDGVVADQAKVKTIVRILGDLLTSEFAPALARALGWVFVSCHEFIKVTLTQLAAAQGKSVEDIKTIIASLHEFNPMMGHRGCRLAVTYPEIAKMQTKAVIRAAINVQKAHADWTVEPEIMIPLVCDVKELKFVKKVVVETADAEIAAAGIDLKYEVGTMIEIPRAALTADEIAKEADFFCFGTNDLTQMTYGFSRDDAGKFLNAYYDAKIFENDPFAKLDQTGVGKLMETAIKLGKPVNNKLHVGICGEHGGDPSSVEFCHKIGLDYVSCSPFRVPIARLAAAQAAIADKK